MQHYGLIGCPLGHSLSPFIHSLFFKISGIEADYRLIEIRPDELKERADELRRLDGFNITIPHKSAIVPLCSAVTTDARRYDSVNCVSVIGGKFSGANTDVYGFRRSIEIMGAPLSGKVALLGCGGVGQMMATEAVLSGAELTIAVRESSRERVTAFAEGLRPLNDKATVRVENIAALSGDYDLMINSTPAGMYPHTAEIPVDEEILGHVGFLFDAVYNPYKTVLMLKAEDSGASVFGGMAMLVLQAARAHELWNGELFSDEALDEVIYEAEQELLNR